MKLGETDEFPQGKLSERDEGEIYIAVTSDKTKGKVMIDFGKSVAWLGMDAAQAIGLGELLIRKAQEMNTVSGDGLDWDEALAHFRSVRNQYQQLSATPGANPHLALAHVFQPLAHRFYRGERTIELYEAMIAVE